MFKILHLPTATQWNITFRSETAARLCLMNAFRADYEHVKHFYEIIEIGGDIL